MTDTPTMLERQLAVALNVNAVFCIGCGQPDEPDLHENDRCPALGGKLDYMPIADALEVFDRSCELLPDLEDHARALHCAIVSATMVPPKVFALVIAAREFWDAHNDQGKECRSLDRALEPFAALVPYANQPAESAA